jgi:hypothetical protein
VAALLTLRTTVRQQIVILASMLFGYWIVMTVLPVPGEGTSARSCSTSRPHHGGVGRPHRARLEPLRSGQSPLGLSVTWDRKACCRRFQRSARRCSAICWALDRRASPAVERLAGLSAAGALGMMAGLMWNWSFPINKSLDQFLRSVHRWL